MIRKQLSCEQIPILCQDLISCLRPKTAILLNGPLGAGKTHLVSELLKALGGDEAVSPTFSLIHSYTSEHNFSIFHVDLYRLEEGEDLESSGFWDLFGEENAIILIEWASKIKKEDLPLDWQLLSIDIEKVSGNESLRQYHVYREGVS